MAARLDLRDLGFAMDGEEEKPEKPGIFTRTVRILQHLPGAALLFAIVPLLMLGYFGWYYYGAEHLDQALYSLQKDRLQVSSQPTWIKSDVVSEVFENAGLDRISLLDPTANATIAQAFEAHNWVKSTARVTKLAGGKVMIDLVYRRPAAMIYYRPDPPLPNAPDASTRQNGFYPVDRDGVVLPTQDFDRDQVFDYFMIWADGARPAGDVGMAFGDVRITAALQLCEYLEPERVELGLERILVDRESRSLSSSPFLLTILTRDKHQIQWGHAPGSEATGEPSAEAKVKRLRSWLAVAREQTERQRIDLMRVGVAGLPAASAGSVFDAGPE